MIYADDLPTPRTASVHLANARAALDVYLMELRDADDSGETPEVIPERLKTVANAMDHINGAIKLIKEALPSDTDSNHPLCYYYMLQDGSGQMVLMRFGAPILIEMVHRADWEPTLNIAYNVLRHQKGDDYAMLWTDRFHHQVTRHLAPPAWLLRHDQVRHWINAHDWRGRPQPHTPAGAVTAFSQTRN